MVYSPKQTLHEKYKREQEFKSISEDPDYETSGSFGFSASVNNEHLEKYAEISLFNDSDPEDLPKSAVPLCAANDFGFIQMDNKGNTRIDYNVLQNDLGYIADNIFPGLTSPKRSRTPVIKKNFEHSRPPKRDLTEKREKILGSIKNPEYSKDDSLFTLSVSNSKSRASQLSDFEFESDTESERGSSSSASTAGSSLNLSGSELGSHLSSEFGSESVSSSCSDSTVGSGSDYKSTLSEIQYYTDSDSASVSTSASASTTSSSTASSERYSSDCTDSEEEEKPLSTFVRAISNKAMRRLRSGLKPLDDTNSDSDSDEVDKYSNNRGTSLGDRAVSAVEYVRAVSNNLAKMTLAPEEEDKKISLEIRESPDILILESSPKADQSVCPSEDSTPRSRGGGRLVSPLGDGSNIAFPFDNIQKNPAKNEPLDDKENVNGVDEWSEIGAIQEEWKYKESGIESPAASTKSNKSEELSDSRNIQQNSGSQEDVFDFSHYGSDEFFEIVPEVTSPKSKVIGKKEKELVNDDISVRSHQKSIQEKASKRSKAQEGSKRANQSPKEATYKLTKSSPFARVPSEGSQSTESVLKHVSSPPLSPRVFMDKIPPKSPNNSKSKQSMSKNDLGNQSLSPRASMSKLPPTSPNSSMASKSSSKPLSPRALMEKIPPKSPNNSKSKQSMFNNDLGNQSLSPRASMSKLPPTSPNSSMTSKSNSKPAASGKGICDEVETNEDTKSISSFSSRQSLRKIKSKKKKNAIEASATSKKTKKSTGFKKVKSSRGRGRDRGRKENKEEMRDEIPTARKRSESRGARMRNMFRRGRSDAAARGPKSTTDDYVTFSKNRLVK